MHCCPRDSHPYDVSAFCQVDPVAIAARVPRVRRASPAVPLNSSHFAEADYCIALRIWDVLLWFSFMRRPRRDVGICADCAHTLAEVSMQLLPKSIFPYDLVPMTRLDPIDKKQVLILFSPLSMDDCFGLHSM